MNVLFVSALLPYPLFSGGQIRIYNLLKTLSRTHDIDLYSFIRSEKENQYIKELSFCTKVETVWRGHAWQASYMLRSLFGAYPFLLSTYANGEMKEKLAEAVQKNHYDLVHIEPGYVWPSISKIFSPLVVSEHNIEHTIYEEYVRRFPIVPLRSLLYADVIKLIWWEKKIWRKADRLVTVSEDDKKVIEHTIGTSKITVVPNGVDLAQFPFVPKKQLNVDTPIFLFVGNFSWIQNQDAVRFLLSDAWPVIRKRYSKAQLRIVGRNMPDRIKKYIKDDTVKLLERVAEINDEYKKADILLAPIRIGGGTKFKILEAMASGLPVVTTAKGAAGLAVRHGKELMIANEPTSVLEAISSLLVDQKKREAIVCAARDCVEKNYSWERIAKNLATVWELAATKPNTPRDKRTMAPPAGRLA